MHKKAQIGRMPAYHPPLEIALEDVEQLGHGGEEQHPVLGVEELDQQPVKHHHLAALGDPLHGLDEERRVGKQRVIAHLGRHHREGNSG
eukprot:scaffold258209_cov49-Prasinocladus_malaysianus.AAC.2